MKDATLYLFLKKNSLFFLIYTMEFYFDEKWPSAKKTLDLKVAGPLNVQRADFINTLEMLHFYMRAQL